MWWPAWLDGDQAGTGLSHPGCRKSQALLPSTSPGLPGSRGRGDAAVSPLYPSALFGGGSCTVVFLWCWPGGCSLPYRRGVYVPAWSLGQNIPLTSHFMEHLLPNGVAFQHGLQGHWTCSGAALPCGSALSEARCGFARALPGEATSPPSLPSPHFINFLAQAGQPAWHICTAQLAGHIWMQYSPKTPG